MVQTEPDDDEMGEEIEYSQQPITAATVRDAAIAAEEAVLGDDSA
jgi:hypothetical protein